MYRRKSKRYVCIRTCSLMYVLTRYVCIHTCSLCWHVRIRESTQCVDPRTCMNANVNTMNMYECKHIVRLPKSTQCVDHVPFTHMSVFPPLSCQGMEICCLKWLSIRKNMSIHIHIYIYVWVTYWRIEKLIRVSIIHAGLNYFSHITSVILHISIIIYRIHYLYTHMHYPSRYYLRYHSTQYIYPILLIEETIHTHVHYHSRYYFQPRSYFTVLFPQKSPIISGSSAESDLQLKTSNRTLPRCIHVHIWTMMYKMKYLSTHMHYRLRFQASYGSSTPCIHTYRINYSIHYYV